MANISLRARAANAIRAMTDIQIRWLDSASDKAMPANREEWTVRHRFRAKQWDRDCIAWRTAKQTCDDVVGELRMELSQELRWELEGFLSERPDQFEQLVRERPTDEERQQIRDGLRGHLRERETSLQQRLAAGSCVKRRMTREQANTEAMRLARKLGRAFFRLSERQQAQQIGCSFGTWKRTQFYKTAQKRRPNAAGPPRQNTPLAVSFTDDLAASVTEQGMRDERTDTVLNQLIAQHEADAEPSPLDPDPPDAKPRKIYTRRRV